MFRTSQTVVAWFPWWKCNLSFDIFENCVLNKFETLVFLICLILISCAMLSSMYFYLYFRLSVSRESTVSIMYEFWRSLDILSPILNVSFLFLLASPLCVFWIECKLLHFTTSNDVMSLASVDQSSSESILRFLSIFCFFSYSTLIEKWFIISLPSPLYTIIHALNSSSIGQAKHFLFFLCYCGYNIVAYEIVQNAIYRLKSNGKWEQKFHHIIYWVNKAWIFLLKDFISK